MLFARLTMTEVAVVRNIHEQLRTTRRELPHQIRKRGFVTNERANLVSGDGEVDYALPRRKVAGLFGDAIHPPEDVGHVLAERHQLDFVVTPDHGAGGVEQERGIQRGARGIVRDAAEQEIRVIGAGDGFDESAEVRVARIERRRSFGPDYER